MHVRGQIREAFRTDMSAIAALTGRVQFDTDEIQEDTSLPWAEVSVGDEPEITHETLGGASGAILSRNLIVYTDIFLRATTETLLAAEDIAASVEAAVASSTLLLALCRSWFLAGIEVIKDNEGEKPLLCMRLQWSVNYATNERNATVAIP